MHSPFSPYNIYPKMVTNIESAYQRNIENGLVIDDDFASDVSTKSLASIVRSKTELEKRKGNIGTFESIANPDTKKAIENSFQIEQDLFDRINLTLPTPEQFAAVGVDFNSMASHYEKMEQKGLEPDIVIAPCLDVDAWRDLCRNLKADDDIKGGDLYINGAIARHWDSIIDVPDDVPSYIAPTLDAPSWTIRLVPGNDDPAQTYVDHQVNDGHHPTVNEYLTLQTTRMQKDQHPMDGVDGTFTWLNGSTDSGYVPFGFYVTDGDVLCIGMGSSRGGAKVGTRLPII